MTELFTLLGKVAVDTQEANESLDDTVDKAEKSEGKLSSIGEKIGNGLQKLAKAGAVVLAATATVAATALVSLSTKAVQCYADYEQLVGGVETLFGAGGQSIEEYADSVGKSVDEVSAEYNNLMKAQDAVIDHANKAYETAGLSANAYMETVTSFSAALISSLDGDTVKAAEVADKAIVDMSDNANKMGSSMESIQNAYQGFAKQNYTMLDNLKLGYGGTKEEMQRLLDDAGKLANQKFDLSSYADIVEAIHVVQENMGIAGTTAKEAATTIQGSIGMMKASWTSITNTFNTIKTTVSDIFTKMKDSITSIFEGIWSAIKGVVNKILGGIETMCNGVIKGINKLLDGIESVANAAGELLGFDPISITLSEVSLPRLAKGTVVKKPTIAEIGEDGAEAIVPLERNTQWIQRVSEEMQNQGGFVGGSEVIELLKVIVELLKIIIKDNGDLPDALLEAIANLRFDIDKREFARLVKAV